VIPDNNIGNRESFGPCGYVFNGLLEFISPAHPVGVGLVVTGIMVIYYVPDKNYLITIVSFIYVQTEIEIPVEFKGAM
jgi:hypothetical protein